MYTLPSQLCDLEDPRWLNGCNQTFARSVRNNSAFTTKAIITSSQSHTPRMMTVRHELVYDSTVRRM